MSTLPENSMYGAFAWFTQGHCSPDFRTVKWRKLLDDLEELGDSPWQYVMFMVYYDRRFGNEWETVLEKVGYRTSPHTWDRYLAWRDSQAKHAAFTTISQLAFMDRQRALGKNLERLLLSKRIDANIMVRLQKAVEWREILGDPKVAAIYDTYRYRAIEMYMGLPWYKELTPLACKLVEASP